MFVVHYFVVQDDCYAFGLNFNSYQRENSTANQYLYNGKEKQNELDLGWLDYGARMYQPELGKFFTQDRFAEKYYGMSPYQYAANNPVLYIDVNGDSIRVNVTTTVNGQAQTQAYYYYNNGDQGYGFYDASGERYQGNDQFIQQVNSGLARLGLGENGAAMVGELVSSENIFTIENSTTNSFDEDKSKVTAAYASQIATDPMYSHLTPGTGGAGGIIKWNPNGANVWVVGGNQDNNPTSNLGHELGHALDSNRGLMDDRLEQGLKRNEWQASYQENRIRSEQGWPTREYYKSQLNNGVLSPYAPKILDSQNRSIKPTWLPAKY